MAFRFTFLSHDTRPQHITRYAMQRGISYCSPARPVPSVSLSVTRQYVVCMETAQRIQLVVPTEAYPTLCYNGIWVSPKIGLLPSGILVEFSAFLHHSASTVATAVNLI